MQLSKMLKGLVIVLPILAIAACSSKKHADNDQSGMLNGNTGIENGSMINGSGEEQARLQLQQLQQQNTVYFGLDKYDILPEYSELLDRHAEFLRSNPGTRITIEGHADERGTPEYNIALGERRANAVKMYLQGKGVSGHQMTSFSYGKEKPAVLGHDEGAYAKNRRAVLDYK